MDEQEQENQQENQPKSSRLRSIKNFFQGVATTLLIIAAAIGIVLVTIYHKRINPLVSYAIVFDAGSSHTEMFVYHWPADKSDGLGTTSAVNELFVCPLASVYGIDENKSGEKIKLKAISDFENHLHLLHDYLRPCLQRALDEIPLHRYKFSPVFLGATAGMRLARLRNETGARQILETIREIFSHYPFQFVTSRQVRILTGMEEAIDGWITTNILLEKFKQRHTPEQRAKSQRTPGALDPDMVGVLDLGGASTQVTFTHAGQFNDEPIPNDFTSNITLFETNYSPYAHSYLCWGKNEAFRRYRARLLRNFINTHRNQARSANYLLLQDPCLASGANDTWNWSDLFRSACTINEKQQIVGKVNASSFTFVGVGNATQCRQRLINLFNSKKNDKNLNCTYKKEYCTFDHTFQPPLAPEINFIGLSGYYYVFNNLAHGMTKPADSTSDRYHVKDFSQQEIDQRLINVCETNYEILYKQEEMTRENEQHKRNLCFDAWYMWLLLTHGIGFKSEDLKRVIFANKFSTGKVGWTLGYMINQTNYIPAEYRERPINKRQFISWFTVTMLVVLITAIFLIITCQRFVRRLIFQRGNHIVRNTKAGYSRPTEQSIA